MNRIIFAFLLAIFSFAAATSTFAQKGAGKGGKKEQRADMTPEERATKATDHMTKRYGLSAEQVAQVKAANLAFATEMKGLKGQGKEAKPQRQAARENHKAALKGIFTAEQNVKFDEDRAKAKERHEARKANKGKGKGGKPAKGEKPAKGDDDAFGILGDDQE